jgi:arsenate reductase
MAEGYLRHFLGERAEVFSAGIETHGVNQTAVRVLKDDGIDISGHTSNNVNEYKDMLFDYVITVCDHARESCPVFPAATKTFHQDFPDPSRTKGSDAEILSAFYQARDMIKEYCQRFVAENFS